MFSYQKDQRSWAQGRRIRNLIYTIAIIAAIVALYVAAGGVQ